MKGKKVKFIIIFIGMLLAVVLAFGGCYLMPRMMYPLKYQEYVSYYGEAFNVDNALIYSVIREESGFNEKAISEKGAKGLMQITDSTAEYIANLLGKKNYDLFDAKTNIEFGVFYLRYLTNRFSDTKSMLASYNAGEGRVREWLKDERYSQDGKTLSKIPYEETERYVEKTYKSFIKYRKLYGDILDKSK
ncbi:MAG: lytic transglycosylase domain-containing protein [Clostridiales bacterium]|nr:lytic transglycosylase domain-containing protein [Clostridiales bacterium]